MNHVVIIGGGIGGMGVATTLAQKLKDVKITVINKEAFYFAGPTRPLLLTGEQKYERIIRGYEEVAKLGINVVIGNVYKIDPNERKVYLSDTSFNAPKELSYDYLVLAPGIIFDGSKINGYYEYRGNIANVYDPGRISVLKHRLWTANIAVSVGAGAHL